MKQCLVVDDSPVIRKVARRILEGMNFQASEAEDGRIGLEACSFLMPDCVLLDANMPNIDGFAFLRELRRMPGGTKPKVIFCTTENDLGQIAKAMHAGADEIMMKPFDKQIMHLKLAEVGIF